MHNLTPFNYRDIRLVADNLRELIGHHASLRKPIEVKMGDCKIRACILSTNSECRARHRFRAFRTTSQPSGKGRLATAKIAYQLNHFTTPQFSPDGFGELLGLLGTCG